ncbi:hypothetical protein CXZ05_03075 [Arthrobacter sp. AFG20]|nr:hypothetical protein CXZ05_03075 [Arthrobacter sp. AFG20]
MELISNTPNRPRKTSKHLFVAAPIYFVNTLAGDFPAVIRGLADDEGLNVSLSFELVKDGMDGLRRPRGRFCGLILDSFDVLHRFASGINTE